MAISFGSASSAGYTTSLSSTPKIAVASLLHSQAQKVKSNLGDSSSYFVPNVGLEGEGSVAVLYVPELQVLGNTEGTFETWILPATLHKSVIGMLEASFKRDTTIFDEPSTAVETVNSAVAKTILSNPNEVGKKGSTIRSKTRNVTQRSSSRILETPEGSSKSITVIFGDIPKEKRDDEASGSGGKMSGLFQKWKGLGLSSRQSQAGYEFLE